MFMLNVKSTTHKLQVLIHSNQAAGIIAISNQKRASLLYLLLLLSQSQHNQTNQVPILQQEDLKSLWWVNSKLYLPILDT